MPVASALKAELMDSTEQDPEYWVNVHGDYLLQFALKRLRNLETAEDLVQDTFVAAFRSRAEYQQRSSLRTWLTGILKHKIMDHFRGAARNPVQLNSEDEFESKFFDASGHWRSGPAQWSVRPDEALYVKDLKRVLDGCLDSLPGILKQVFVLHEIEEMETSAICELLQLSSANLYTALHRARFKLRHCVEANWHGKQPAQ